MNKLLALLIFVTCQFAYGTYDLEVTDDFEAVVGIIDSVTKKHGPEDTLIIFDIDHTLILIDQCLDKPKKEENKKVNKEKFAHFIKQVYNCDAYLTSTSLPDLIYDLQKADYPVMALTARGGNLVTPTLEQLQTRLRLTIEKSTKKNPNMAEIYFHTAPAYNDKETTHPTYMGKKKMKSLTYKEGVALVGGANKGKALQGFLKDIGHSYKQIIFVDDSQRNITNLEKAYDETEEHMTIIHYTEFDRKKKKKK